MGGGGFVDRVLGMGLGGLVLCVGAVVVGFLVLSRAAGWIDDHYLIVLPFLGLTMAGFLTWRVITAKAKKTPMRPSLLDVPGVVLAGALVLAGLGHLAMGVGLVVVAVVVAYGLMCLLAGPDLAPPQTQATLQGGRDWSTPRTGVGQPWRNQGSGDLSTETMSSQYRSQADQLRAQAADFDRQAGNWRVGGQGERKTIALLAQLGPEWTVLHDRGLPNSNANVDHVLVGPGGVVVVDTKAAGRNLTALNGRLLWHGLPADDKLETTRWEAERVAQILGRPGSVPAVWAVWGQDVPFGQACGVTVLAAENILDYVANLRPVLSVSQSQRVASLAERMLPPR